MKPLRGLTLDEPGYFERLAEIETGHWWSVAMWRLARDWLQHRLAGQAGVEALDVGCGAGGTAVRLAARPEIGSVIGIDPSPDALRHAASRGVRTVAAGACRLPFRDASFDLVTCLDVLQHLSSGDDCYALREIARVLRPEGIALIRSNGRGWLSDADALNDVRTYRLDELRDRVRSAGMIVERASYANCLPSIAQEVVGRLIWPFRGEAGMLPHPSRGGLRIRMPSPTRNRILGTVSTAEGFLAGKCGLVLPFGHSTLVLARKSAVAEGRSSTRSG